jgi:cold shock protein
MAQGTVKWFNHEKGFGFITPDEAGRDLFVHQSQVEGGSALDDGAKVEFESEESDKGPRAVQVRAV